LLHAIIEKVKVLAAQASNELSARVGNNDADVDTVHANANVGRGLCVGLLRDGGRREQEGAQNKKSSPKSREENHRPIWNRRMATENAEALSGWKFPRCGQGFSVSAEGESRSA
jgi:hypothetical protein